MEYMIDGFMNQTSRYLLMYILLLIPVVLNTTLALIRCGRGGPPLSTLLLVENLLITLAMLIGCVINVILLDAGGRRLSEAFAPTNNVCLYMTLVGGGLTAVSFGAALVGWTRNKKRRA